MASLTLLWDKGGLGLIFWDEYWLLGCMFIDAYMLRLKHISKPRERHSGYGR